MCSPPELWHDKRPMNDKNQLVVMALGPDRVGLVAQVTGFLRERGGNIEDSRMASLGSEFGVMILVAGPEPQLARIEADIGKLADLGMNAIVRRASARAPGDSPPKRATIVAEALDHEGIVYALSAAIERLGVNIASLQTACYNAPWSGAPLFRLEALVDLPSAMDIDTVRSGVADVAESENLEIRVVPEAVKAR